MVGGGPSSTKWGWRLLLLYLCNASLIEAWYIYIHMYIHTYIYRYIYTYTYTCNCSLILNAIVFIDCGVGGSAESCAGRCGISPSRRRTQASKSWCCRSVQPPRPAYRGPPCSWHPHPWRGTSTSAYWPSSRRAGSPGRKRCCWRT